MRKEILVQKCIGGEKLINVFYNEDVWKILYWIFFYEIHGN